MGRMSERVGTVVRSHGGHYYVDTGDEVVDCTMRGRVKQLELEIGEECTKILAGGEPAA